MTSGQVLNYLGPNLSHKKGKRPKIMALGIFENTDPEGERVGGGFKNLIRDY